jgi:3-dehydroquinate synthase
MPIIFCHKDFREKLRDWLKETSVGSVFILTDERVAEFYLPDIKESIGREFNPIIIKGGEESKNLSTCQLIWSHLLEADADRSSLLINLGGGMITDLGGFAASVFKRGISFIHIPTTLLAMVDAAVGGKTGINYGAAKNQLGTFYQPEAVFIEPSFLQSLPPRQLLSGYAEVLKYGLIYQPEIWKEYSSILPSEITNWEDCIRQCIEVKENIVSKDPLEKGLRKILNFGHTIGHALEAYSLENNSDSLTHGEAVAAGMLVEAFLSCNKGLLSKTEFDEILERLNKLYPLYSYPQEAIPELIYLMRKDKKNRNGKISFVLLKKIGESVWNQELEEEEIIQGLEFCSQLPA